MMVRALTPLLVLVTVSCGTSLMPTKLRGRDADPKIIEMEKRILELQRKAAIAEVEVARLRQQLARLEEMTAARQGLSATSSFRPGDRRRSATGGAAAAGAVQPLVEESDLEIVEENVGTSAPLSGVQSQGTAISSAGQTLYDRGYTEFHQGRYLNSETSFRRFLQSHGQTELADNAQFWIGEARFARGDTHGALAAFQETVERYPQGNKVPDALLKIGECSQRLGEPARARGVYEELVRRFPSTAAAATAQDRLGQMRRN